MDKINIKNLEVHCRVGVPDEERKTPQRLLFSLIMKHDFTAAAASDNLEHTINYYAVCQHLLKKGEGREWKLLETLAVEVAGDILGQFGACGVKVTIKKFIIPQADYVGVTIKRSRPV